ncbi:teicoplanin resistance protein VanZ [bacterium]|nr:MAG: teicoplanin resistance protein VanZ [bacterium]
MDKKKKNAIILWGITVGYMVIIYYFSSLSGHLLPFSIRDFDKALHFCVYSVLAFLFYLSFRKSGLKRHIFLLSLLITAMYGVIDEIHQLYVPGRVFSFGDVAADIIGGFSGSAFASLKVLK